MRLALRRDRPPTRRASLGVGPPGRTCRRGPESLRWSRRHPHAPVSLALRPGGTPRLAPSTRSRRQPGAHPRRSAVRPRRSSRVQQALLRAQGARSNPPPQTRQRVQRRPRSRLHRSLSIGHRQRRSRRHGRRRRTQARVSGACRPPRPAMRAPRRSRPPRGTRSPHRAQRHRGLRTSRNRLIRARQPLSPLRPRLRRNPRCRAPHTPLSRRIRVPDRPSRQEPQRRRCRLRSARFSPATARREARRCLRPGCGRGASRNRLRRESRARGRSPRRAA
jgi:hypothetical protein